MTKVTVEKNLENEVVHVPQSKEQTIYRRYKRKWYHDADERALAKLPNEFRDSERDINVHNEYYSDSWCGLYVDEN